MFWKILPGLLIKLLKWMVCHHLLQMIQAREGEKYLKEEAQAGQSVPTVKFWAQLNPALIKLKALQQNQRKISNNYLKLIIVKVNDFRHPKLNKSAINRYRITIWGLKIHSSVKKFRLNILNIHKYLTLKTLHFLKDLHLQFLKLIWENLTGIWGLIKSLMNIKVITL